MSGPSMSLIDLLQQPQSLSSLVRTDTDSPHRRHDALEASMQHRCCKVHNLIRLLFVALGRLARRQIREPRLVEVHIHQLGHCQLPVAKVEAALERVVQILGSVACEMNKVGRLYPARHALHCGGACNGFDSTAGPTGLRCGANVGHLPVDVIKRRHGR
jgi:hypothetical protein